MDGMNMDEMDIEIAVERKIDRLDREYMRGDFDEAEYKRRMAEIDKWAREQQRT